MERNTDRLIGLTDQLLDFRRVETNKFHLDFKRINITEFLAERFISFKSITEQENKKFELKMPSQTLFACVDADAFYKILNNLFTNAIKYSKNEVFVCLLPSKENDDNFTIEFRNDGYIIPAEMKEKIFEPFFRITETKTQTGSGIGLAISRSLTELHNGKLFLKEPDNEMNIFVLTLPVQQPAELTLE